MSQVNNSELQLAYYLLIRYCSSVSKVLNGKYYDFIASTADCSSRLAVKVISINSPHSTVDEIKRFINDNTKERELAIPVVLLYVDIDKGEGQFELFLEWRYNYPKTHYDTQIVPWTEANVDVLFNSIDTTIRILPQKMMRVIKSIIIPLPQDESAKIIYCRSFSETYKMKPTPPLTETERFKRNLNGVPEEEYPSDILDSAILEMIRKQHQDASVKSSLMICNTELRDLQNYKNYQRQTWNAIIVPRSISAEICSIQIEAFGLFLKEGSLIPSSMSTIFIEDNQLQPSLIRLANSTYQPLSSFLIK